MESLGLPAKVKTVSFGFYVGRSRQRQMVAADQHNEIEINFVERGELVFRHGANLITLSKGSMIIYWAAAPHQVTSVTTRTEISWLVLPLSWFLSWNLDSPLLRGLLHGEMLVFPRESKGISLPPLAQWAQDFATKSSVIRLAVKLELEAYFRRLDFGIGRRKRSKSMIPSLLTMKNHRYDRIQEMVRFMTEHSGDNVTITQIAEAAALNREYAMRLFRKNWGMTLWDFLLQQRIFRAKRLLILSDAKVTDIALECGFASVSRFYSAFAKYCHCTPLAFRRQHNWNSKSNSEPI